MKTTLLLLALLGLGPLAARAQSGDGSYDAYKTQMQNGAVEDAARRQQAAARPAVYSAPARTSAQRSNDRANRRADRADIKAHGGTEPMPGGYRWDKKAKRLIKPDGTYAGAKEAQPAKSQPAKPQAAPATQRPIDPENSLGKLQEFNRQEEARRKAAAKPIR